MKIKEALQKHSSIEIDLLLSYILGKPKEFLYINQDNNLTIKQLNRLQRLIKRRLKGEPMAYILGYKDFYGLRFKVNRDVLVPRPETELMVEKTIERLKNLKIKRLGRKIRILDIGTGSGCVIISIAKALSAKHIAQMVELYASDISQKALNLARKNFKHIIKQNFHTTQYESFAAKVKFMRSDLLGNVKIDPDIVVANLPYGWRDWKNQSLKETKGLKFEPKQALFTKDHGLYQINRLLYQIAQRKVRPKIVLLEFDPRQKAELTKSIKKYLPEAETKFFKDYGGFWRLAEIMIV